MFCTPVLDEQYLKKDKKGRKSSKLLNSLLGCVQKVSLFDTQNFINKERFNMLMQPLLDQVSLLYVFCNTPSWQGKGFFMLSVTANCMIAKWQKIDEKASACMINKSSGNSYRRI